MEPYYTLVIHRTVPKFTNQWNDFSGIDWQTMVRGNYPTEQAACERAREILPHGAPFTVKLVHDSDDDSEHDQCDRALDNIVGPGAQHEYTCDQAEHDEDSACIWCEARAALSKRGAS